MKISAFMSPDDIVVGLSANSKKQVLEDLVNHACKTVDGLDSRLVFEQLMERERLGCTGIGDGIAIPHTRCALPETLTMPVVRLAMLDKAIDFEANDNLPVDIVFMMLAPEGTGGEHLAALALASRLMRQDGFAQRMREAKDPTTLWTVLSNENISNAA